MIYSPTAIPDVWVLTPIAHVDARGWVVEMWRDVEFRTHITGAGPFVQENHTHSVQHVLRGLHYQEGQGKLVRVVRGAVFDVAVDLRPSSPTCGQWVAEELSAENGRQLWIPPGCAHGFLVLSDVADTIYKMTAYYNPALEGAIRWNDPALSVAWPTTAPILSDKDRLAPGWVRPAFLSHS
jgi:dTDP-4-dehydrorhamnose 3,5-epimerase